MTREELLEQAKKMGIVVVDGQENVYGTEDGQFFSYAGEAHNYVYGKQSNLRIEEFSKSDLSGNAKKSELKNDSK